MFKFIKKIKELENRVKALEKTVDQLFVSSNSTDVKSSYEEVIDHWLNGTRQ